MHKVTSLCFTRGMSPHAETAAGLEAEWKLQASLGADQSTLDAIEARLTALLVAA